MATCIKCGKPTKAEHFKLCEDCYKAQRGSSSRPKRFSLPEGYLTKGYFDEHENLREELITSHAKDIAYVLDQLDMKVTALRKFFSKVKAIERKFESELRKKRQASLNQISDVDRAAAFAAIVPDINELKPYAKNAVTREVAPRLFGEFIELNVDCAKRDEKAFCKGFVRHFEYIVAFFPRK